MSYVLLDQDFEQVILQVALLISKATVTLVEGAKTAVALSLIYIISFLSNVFYSIFAFKQCRTAKGHDNRTLILSYTYFIIILSFIINYILSNLLLGKDKISYVNILQRGIPLALNLPQTQHVMFFIVYQELCLQILLICFNVSYFTDIICFVDKTINIRYFALNFSKVCIKNSSNH